MSDLPTSETGSGSIAPPRDWRLSSACVQLDPEEFFPIGDERTSARQWDHARQACRACPVSTQCLQFALDSNTDFGMWGGYTPRERQRMRWRRDHAAEDRRALFGPNTPTSRPSDDPLSTVHMAAAEAVPGARTPTASVR